MRLLKTGPYISDDISTLELYEDNGDYRHSGKHRYAILSHTWGAPKDEVLFSDLVAGCDTAVRRSQGRISVNLDDEPSIREKPGWRKLAFALEQADQDGKEWLFVDTACIDRSSSAELAEAINSMWSWLTQSRICYAYLSDLAANDAQEIGSGKTFRLHSRWFTRGWTLPELLAPGHVVFYSEEWVRLGDKHDLSAIINTLTDIHRDVIEGRKCVEDVSVAQRMSWAANRETRLPEDRAYSLLGLFGVNMSVLYGEGDKAFLRLQEEIIRLSADHSIFAWKDDELGNASHGLLAASPRAFAESAAYVPLLGEEIQTFEMSNRGIRISLHIIPDRTDDFIATLQCADSSQANRNLAVYLRKLGSGSFSRVRCHDITSVPTDLKGNLGEIYVRQKFAPSEFRASTISNQNDKPTLALPVTSTTLASSVGINGTASSPLQDNSSSQYEYPASPQDGMPGPSNWPIAVPKSLKVEEATRVTSGGVVSPDATSPARRDSAHYTTQIFHISKFRTWGGKYELMDVSFRPPKTQIREFPDLYQELQHPSEIPNHLCATFRMVTEDHRITAALLVSRQDDVISPHSRITILLGSGYDGEPGYDIVEVRSLGMLKTCKKPFEPMSFGTTAFSKHHRVMIKADVVVKGNVKCHLLDVSVGALGKTIEAPESVASMDSKKTRSMSAYVQRVVSRKSHGSVT